MLRLLPVLLTTLALTLPSTHNTKIPRCHYKNVTLYWHGVPVLAHKKFCYSGTWF